MADVAAAPSVTPASPAAASDDDDGLLPCADTALRSVARKHRGEEVHAGLTAFLGSGTLTDGSPCWRFKVTPPSDVFGLIHLTLLCRGAEHDPEDGLLPHVSAAVLALNGFVIDVAEPESEDDDEENMDEDGDGGGCGGPRVLSFFANKVLPTAWLSPDDELCVIVQLRTVPPSHIAPTTHARIVADMMRVDAAEVATALAAHPRWCMNAYESDAVPTAPMELVMQTPQPRWVLAARDDDDTPATLDTAPCPPLASLSASWLDDLLEDDEDEDDGGECCGGGDDDDDNCVCGLCETDGGGTGGSSGGSGEDSGAATWLGSNLLHLLGTTHDGAGFAAPAPAVAAAAVVDAQYDHSGVADGAIAAFAASARGALAGVVTLDAGADLEMHSV